MDELPRLKGDLALPPLPDHLAPGLKLLFIGFNPGERSAQIGHYYGYRGNRFWWLLWQSGLTERQVPAEEDHTLPERYGYGLTDLVDRPSKSSGELAGWELRAGRDLLLTKLQQYRPRVACYNGKGVYQALTGKRQFDYGRQPDQAVDGVIDFVAPSPSGRSREPIAEKLRLYTGLRTIVTEL